MQRCRFDIGPNDVGLRLPHDAAGVVRSNAVRGGGSLWGRLAPPAHVVSDGFEEEGGDGDAPMPLDDHMLDDALLDAANF